MGGINELAAVTRVAPDGEIERLERRGLLELYKSGDRTIIGLRPPVLAEYFKRNPSAARNNRLLERYGKLLDQSAISVEFALGGGSDLAPQFVRLINEHLRAATAAARAVWERKRSLESFTAYLGALRISSIGTREIDDAFASAEDLSGDEEHEVRRHLLFAEHVAYTLEEPQRAVDDLLRNARSLPTLGSILLSRAAEISADLLIVPDPETLPDPAGVGMPPEAAVAAHRARAYAHMLRGEISLAMEHLAAATQETDPTSDIRTAVIAGMCKTMQGDISAASALASRGMDESRRNLDPVGMRAFGALAAFASMCDSRYDRVQRVLDTVLPLGEPFQWPPGAQLSLMIMASITASRQGRRRVATQRLADAESLPMPDSSLPGGARGWAHTQAAAAEGRPADAVEIALVTADQLWARDARLAAASAYLAAAEIDHSSRVLERVRVRVALVDAPLLRLHLRYVEALAADDAPALMQAGAEFEDGGRFGLALNAYERAATTNSRAGSSAGAREARARRKHLLEVLPAEAYDSIRWGPRFVDLTSREEEIALLASDGLTNQQIANELVLSVRTVESHLLRAMKKIGVERRTLLRDYFDNETSD